MTNPNPPEAQQGEWHEQTLEACRCASREHPSHFHRSCYWQGTFAQGICSDCRVDEAESRLAEVTRERDEWHERAGKLAEVLADSIARIQSLEAALKRLRDFVEDAYKQPSKHQASEALLEIDAAEAALKERDHD